MNIIEQINAEQMTRELPEFNPGDTVIVSVKVKEGNRERLQAFEGVVIAVKNRGLNSAFTVRKISHGTGVERVFQTHSKLIDSIKVKRRGAVRRAKHAGAGLAAADAQEPQPHGLGGRRVWRHRRAGHDRGPGRGNRRRDRGRARCRRRTETDLAA